MTSSQIELSKHESRNDLVLEFVVDHHRWVCMRFAHCDDRLRVRSRCHSGRPSQSSAYEPPTSSYDPPHFGIAELDGPVMGFIVGAIIYTI